jgi:hypothetical protein
MRFALISYINNDINYSSKHKNISSLTNKALKLGSMRLAGTFGEKFFIIDFQNQTKNEIKGVK